MSPEELFWDLVEPLYADPSVSRSTMMGLPCVRLDGRFFASLDRRTGALLVKLSAERVGALIAAGHGVPFAPAGRVFREWVAIPRPDRRRWRTLLAEARSRAAGGAPSTTPNRDTVGFTGFGVDGLEFLSGLAKDNSTNFFDAHRSVYERDLLAPAKLFVAALGARLRQQVSTDLQVVPRVGGSIFRIANDRRFNPKAPPYKPHLDFAFWQGGDGPRTDPSLILRITPDRIVLGAGVYALTGERLARYREALHDPAALAVLDEAVDGLLADGADLSEPTRSRPPRGFDPGSPAARYAVRERLHVTRDYPVPKAITTPTFVDWCAERLRLFGPIHTWLTHHLKP